jgi:hypothetical protein
MKRLIPTGFGYCLLVAVFLLSDAVLPSNLRKITATGNAPCGCRRSTVGVSLQADHVAATSGMPAALQYAWTSVMDGNPCNTAFWWISAGLLKESGWTLSTCDLHCFHDV